VAAADLEILPWEDPVVLAGPEEAAPGKDSASKVGARFRVGSPAAVAQGEAAECFAKP
jgi:hypothetical protein